MSPLLPSADPLFSIPEHRIRPFLKQMAERLRPLDARERRALLPQLAQEQLLFAVALEDPVLAAAMDRAFQQALAAQAPHPRDALDEAGALRDMGGIRRRRAADARAFAQMLKDPSWQKELWLLASQPPSQTVPYRLPPAKQEEIIRRLVQTQDPDGPEPTIHVMASALGHRQVHEALMRLYDPDAGLLKQPLLEALQRATPEGMIVDSEALMDGWLRSRYQAAKAVTDGVAQDGALLREALLRSQAAFARKAAPVALPRTVGLATDLAGHTVLTPREREARKSPAAKANDWMYTLNHAATCLSLTDLLIAPAVSSALGWHGEHDHSHGHSDGGKHSHPLPAVEQDASLWRRSTAWLRGRLPAAKEWMIGEAAGDMGAVPLTVAMQRLAPNMMDGMAHAMEPLVGNFMQRRAQHASQKWAHEEGIDPLSDACVDHAEHLYAYEMRHLPQMAVWTAASSAINYGVMKSRNPAMPFLEFAQNKVLGAGITAGLVLGARSFSPEKAHGWDHWMGQHVLLPIGRSIGSVFGMGDDEIASAMEAGELDGVSPSRQVSQVHRDALQSTPHTPSR